MKSKKAPTKAKPDFCKDHPRFVELAKVTRKAALDNPKLGMLFMVNPVLAMKEVGLEVNTAMTERIKKTINKSDLTEGDSKLFNKVKKGKTKIPWVDKVTFRKTKIAELIGE